MGSDFKKIFKARTESEVSSTEVPAKKKKALKGKRSDPSFTQVSAYIPKELHKQIKIELMDSDQDFSGLVTELLTEWLEK
ncbi:MAG: hypothetical protein WBB82_09020 [Limnothrix sp.]